ncbi:MAG: hypothetical protein ACT6RD_07490, partial [Brevundimonas sp.]
IYAVAPQRLRALIISQAERRLADQNSFAQAADARAATITGASSALAAASAGLLGVALTGTPNFPLAAGSVVGVVGFATAAHHALRSARCLQFHAAGYPPNAFVEDIDGQKSQALIEAEMMAELDTRLAFNSEVLRDRGDMIDAALKRLWATPFYVGLAIAITWCAGAALPNA